MVSNGTDNMVMPVAPMYGGYNGCNGNGFGWGGDWAWIILLLLIGAMVDVVKDIETIEAMKDYQPEDWMRGYSREYDEDYSMTRAPYNRHDDYSYARGRDAMGRYTSRDNSKQEMIDHLNRMMMNARTPEERESYRTTIEHMSRN